MAAWFGPAIAAAGSVVGGMLSDRSDRRHDRQMADRNEALQREFAQHGIRWRVEDAQAAGVHPLYALGGGVTPFSPSVSVGSQRGLGEGLARAGQEVGRAIQAQETPDQRREREMRLGVLAAQAEKDHAIAAYYQSQAARAGQSARQSAPMPAAIPSAEQFLPRHQDVVKPKADEVISSRRDDRSVTAGTHPGLREYTIAPSGLKIRLPYSEEGPSEALENIPWYAWPAMIEHNRSYYGSDWGTRFLREFVFGKSPVYRRYPDRPVLRVPEGAIERLLENN